MLEQENQHQLIWFSGLLLLPIGSRINIDNVSGFPAVPLDPGRFPTGRADAVVVNVRLWGTQGPSCLVLEVELTEAGDVGGWMVDR